RSRRVRWIAEGGQVVEEPPAAGAALGDRREDGGGAGAVAEGGGEVGALAHGPAGEERDVVAGVEVDRRGEVALDRLRAGGEVGKRRRRGEQAATAGELLVGAHPARHRPWIAVGRAGRRRLGGEAVELGG